MPIGLGALLLHNSVDGSTVDQAQQTPPAAVTSAAPAPPASPASPAAPKPTATARDQALPRSAPKRLSIPAIGVDAPFTGLSIGKSGQLNAPPANDDNLVGWFEGGASPGERGSSIVVGHVDTKTGPAVFVLLRTLNPGAMVNITRADGTVARFKVDSVDTFSKANFPDDKVYADTPTPQLRLITCGGKYNRTSRDYEANVVVFAHLDGATRA
nr:class F sortase [Streptomyces sp. TRM49041]